MSFSTPALLMLLFLALCLALIALGLPGTWLMLLGAALYGTLASRAGPGLLTLVGLLSIAVAGEVIEFWLSQRFTLRYGGSNAAGWGALGGGLVGAFVGLPVPVVGPLIGAFAGAFVGALIVELTRGRDTPSAARAARGALLGRLLGSAAKGACGVVMAAWIMGAVS
jgi:hypothetical protein